MAKLDDVATDVETFRQNSLKNKSVTMLDDIIAFNDIVDDVFEIYDTGYEDGDFSRELSDDEKGIIIESLINEYGVKGMDKEDIMDNAWNEYLD